MAKLLVHTTKYLSSTTFIPCQFYQPNLSLTFFNGYIIAYHFFMLMVTFIYPLFYVYFIPCYIVYSLFSML